MKPPVWNVSPYFTEAPELWRGLVGFWPFWEGGGGVARDIAGQTHGTLEGGAAWAAGQNGHVLYFGSVGDHVDLGTPESLNITEPLTICARITIDSDGLNNRSDDFFSNTIIGRRVGDNYQYHFRIKHSGELSFLGSASSQDSSFSMSNGESAFVAVRLDANANVVFFKNDEKDDTANTKNVSKQSLPTKIAQNDSNGDENAHKGSISYVMVFNEAKLDSDINKIYNDPFAMLRPRMS